MSFKFTYDSYRSLLSTLQETHSFVTYDQIDEQDSGVILRHDVDWSPSKAQKMARIEAEQGIKSTFFFLLTSPFYNLLSSENRDALEGIDGLGHQVRLHFSTHQYWDAEPEHESLVERVDEERAVLERIIDDNINVVSFHIPPDWIFGRTFEGFTNTYEPRFFEEIEYRGDSNQRWRDDHPFSNSLSNQVQILVHPGLWGESDENFKQRLESELNRQFSYLRDFMNSQYIENQNER